MNLKVVSGKCRDKVLRRKQINLKFKLPFLEILRNCKIFTRCLDFFDECQMLNVNSLSKLK